MRPLALIAACFIPMAVFSQEVAPETAPEEVAPLVDQLLMITNQTGQVMVRFAVTPAPSTQAETGVAPETDAPEPTPPAPMELLRGAIITPGSFGRLNVPGGGSVCLYTLTATLADGAVRDIEQDICQSDAVVFE